MAVLAVAVAIAGCGRQEVAGNSDGSGDAPASATRANEGAKPEAARTLPVLGTPRTATDALPLQPRGTPLGSPFTEINARRSRRAMTTEGATVYVIPTEDAACAVIAAGADERALVPACASARELANRDPSFVEVSTGCTGADPRRQGAVIPTCTGSVVFGLAPQGVKAVDAQLGDGRSVPAQLANNTFVAKVPGDATVNSVEFSTGE